MAKITIAIELDIDTQTYKMGVTNPTAHCPHCGAIEAAGLLATCYNELAKEANDMALAGTAGKPN